jgi:hypothetical protein
MERPRPAEIVPLLESLTPEERQTLDRFREAAPVKFNDHVLARFLRARKFVFDKAMEMYTKYLTWRTEQDLDHISEFEFPEAVALKEYYPHGFHKTDRFGRMIYIERYCSIDMKRIFEITTEERMIRYYLREYESMVTYRLPACCIAAGYPVEQSFTILDLGGSSTKLMKKNVYNFVKLASGIAQDYYPEILGKMFIINSPTLFSIAWKVIRPWIDERTQKKITIEGSKYQKKLLELVAPENLPDFLGGTCVCEGGCLNSDIGPWRDPEILRQVRATDTRL